MTDQIFDPSVALQDHLSESEITRTIKAALRKAFPSARFSVTRGGAHIEWTDDGPTVEQVGDALLAAKCVVQEPNRNGERWLGVPGNYYGNSIWFDRCAFLHTAATHSSEETIALCHEIIEKMGTIDDAMFPGDTAH